MLLPALARAKQQAQQVACMNNLKQLTLATKLYMNDTSQMVDHPTVQVNNSAGHQCRLDGNSGPFLRQSGQHYWSL